MMTLQQYLASPQRAIPLIRQVMVDNQPAVVDGQYPEAAVVVAVTVGGDEPEVILTRRAMHMNIHPGEAAFPGGKRDLDDENLLATGLREANEEVGLLANDFELLGQLDQRLTKTEIKVTPFVGLVPADVQLQANLQELDCVYRVPISYFLDSKHLLIAEREYRGKLCPVPHFKYQQHTVWGVTALMIIDLMDTVFGVDLMAALAARRG